MDRPAHQVAAHGWDDAERAAMVAALRNLDVGIMPGGQPYSLRWDKTGERIVRLRQMLVNSRHDLGEGLRARHCEYFRMRLPDDVPTVLRAEATGHDDFAVFSKGLADGIQGFLYSAVDKSARIDNYQVRILIGRRGFIAFSAQLSEDLLRVHQGLGATERDETNFGRLLWGHCHN